MPEYTFQELIEMPTKKLLDIKYEKRRELREAQKEKANLCANIISLQGMIKAEKEAPCQAE